MSRTVRVAAIQSAYGDDIDANIARTADFVRQAAARGANIVLPSELFEGPYFCVSQQERWFARARPWREHPCVLAMSDLAAELGVAIPVSIFERDGPHYFNSLVMLDADGVPLGLYRKSDGKAEMKNLHCGKGANLAELTNLGIPVPAGFTITTEVCTLYYKNKRKYPKELSSQVDAALVKVEKIMGKKFGDPENPLLVSVRSGARSSMPGMMETVLNVGLTTKTIPGLIRKTDNPRFVYDAYRRLMMMYSDVVMEKAAGVEPKTDHDAIRHKLETAMERLKKQKGYKNDTDLTVEDLQKHCDEFKKIIKAPTVTKRPILNESLSQNDAIGPWAPAAVCPAVENRHRSFQDRFPAHD